MDCAVWKVGDYYGTDSSGEPFEWMSMVFWTDSSSHSTIFSELVHHGCRHLMLLEPFEQPISSRLSGRWTACERQAVSNVFGWEVAIFVSRCMSGLELFLLLLSWYCAKLSDFSFLLFKAHLARERLDVEYINMKQYARWWLHHLSSFKIAFGLQHLPQF